jgi:hypothetical protein
MIGRDRDRRPLPDVVVLPDGPDLNRELVRGRVRVVVPEVLDLRFPCRRAWAHRRVPVSAMAEAPVRAIDYRPGSRMGLARARVAHGGEVEQVDVLRRQKLRF